MSDGGFPMPAKEYERKLENKLDSKRREIRETLDGFVEDPNHKPFYRWDYIEANGPTCDGAQTLYRSEVIAEWMLEKQASGVLDEILCDPKQALEHGEHAEGRPIHDPEEAVESLRGNKQGPDSEDTICKELFLSYCPDEGTYFTGADGERDVIVDYQVPVNRVYRSTRSCVDLLIKSDGKLLVGEAKRPKSNENLLRAATEAEAYCLRIVAPPDAAASKKAKTDKLKCDATSRERFENVYGSSDLAPAVLLFETMTAWKDYQRLCDGTYECQLELFKSWGVRFFKVIDIDELKPAERKRYPMRDDWPLKWALRELPQPWRA